VNSKKLHDWVQILGTVAIVVSLVFVGLQLRQTHSIAIANQYQERAALNINYQLAALQNDTVLAFHGSNRKQQFLSSDFPDEVKKLAESLSDEVAGLLGVSTIYSYLVFDNNHFQYQSGFLAEETWQVYRNELKGYLNGDTYLFVWSRTKDTYRPGFQELVDELILENRTEID
jgi:hypothetical protein